MSEIFIPSYRLIQDAKPHYVYTIEVTSDCLHQTVEKRYSAFHALHRELRKNFTTPAFPPKRVRCSQPKVLEQRRLGLERYLQTMMKFGPSRTQVMQFLGFSTSSIIKNNSMNINHQPVFRVTMATNSKRSTLPDIITEGVISAVYRMK